MTKRQKEQALLLSKNEIAPGIFDIRLHTERIAGAAGAGQFVALYCKDESRLLPRPISICEIDRKEHAIRLVFRVAGKGTEEFSRMEAGMRIDVMGPLGNGFSKKKTTALLVGGGIGIPPMLALAQELECEKQIVLGYRDTLFLQREFEAYGTVSIATEDGSAGTKGTVLDVIQNRQLHAQTLYACGPLPMLRALKQYAAEQGMECQVSLEERMACGIGACLGCVCKSKEIDAHTNVNNKRICKEGPVFAAEEVEF